MKKAAKQTIVMCSVVFLCLTLLSAISARADIIASDGFEDQDWNSDQGTAWGKDNGESGDIEITNETKQSGTYAAEIGNESSNTEFLELAVDTSGYTDIVFSYYRAEGGGWESADSFKVEWFDGADWHTLEHIYDDWGQSMVFNTFNLGNGANDNPAFKIRFTHDNPTSGGYESVFLDDIAVQEQLLPRLPIPLMPRPAPMAVYRRVERFR